MAWKAISDFGEFERRFLCSSIIFWVLVGVLMFKRLRPSWVERALIAVGPMTIFLAMVFAGL